VLFIRLVYVSIRCEAGVSAGSAGGMSSIIDGGFDTVIIM
jgi:hypothetical protein